MKTPISCFLLPLTVFLVATTWSAQAQVLDTDGDAIFRGSYYVLPFVRGQGGGVTLAGRGDNPCPLDVVQESSETEKGLPIQFSNWMAKIPGVPLNANLNIETKVAATICMQPTYWWVHLFSIDGNQFLTTGPKPEGNRRDSLPSFFQIQEAGYRNVYKIMFCPGDFTGNGKASKRVCANVGIHDVDENGVRRLALNFDKPFLVQFKKAEAIDTLLSNNM